MRSTMFLGISAIFYYAIASAAEATVEVSKAKVLTPDNFQDEIFLGTRGVIVKFYAPWCGHCKKLAPIWEKLAEEFMDSEDVLVAKVDCVADEQTKHMCQEFGIKGYPTIKIFTPDTAEDGDAYEGSRDLESLIKFVKENVGPTCRPDHESLCSESQREFLQKAMKMDAEELKAELLEQKEKVREIQKQFIGEYKKLEAMLHQEYDKIESVKTTAMNGVMPMLRLLRSVANKQGFEVDTSPLPLDDEEEMDRNHDEL